MKPNEETVNVTRELLTRYDKPGPRYTSYPTAPEWHDEFDAADYRQALVDASTRPTEPLSVYIHIPFCHERCVYCGCNTVVTAKEGVADRYLDYLEREMALAADGLGDRRRVMQLHWGGGTPTYLGLEQMNRLNDVVRRYFTIDPLAEVALEIDPRHTTQEQLARVREVGFNRVSIGVQDLNIEVQRAISRYQTEEETRETYRACRDLGFEGINFDLVYGLPFQRPDSWEASLRSVLDMRPDRLAVYSYAHVPWMRPHQKWIREETLPRGPEKYELFTLARRMLVGAGYQAIGMDHFALPEDELSMALAERRLHRNFMGYTVVPATEMISFGTSAIGEIGGCYAQNHVKLSKYYEALDKNELPTIRGCTLSADDKIRRWLIRRLMCDFYLDTGDLEKRFDVRYDDYFAAEEKELAEFYEGDFLAREGDNILVLPLGQVFIRNVAMIFDAYLKKPEGHRQFSRTV